MGNGSNSNTTLEDLAKLAGVSVSTVSRALNDQPLISARTKQRIWALAREHNYPFRMTMPASPIGAEGSIAIVTPHVRSGPLPLSHPFFLELLASIGEAARARGCDFTVSHVSPTSYEDLLHATTTSRASGVIFLGQSVLHEAFNQLAETSARFVVWGAQMRGQRYCSIGSDNELGGRRATLHLARLGRKAILFIGGSDLEAVQRREGYSEALKESGLEADPRLIVPVDFELESAEAAVGRLLRRRVHFDGIVASSDLIALGAINALRRAGLSVPRDVSVVGYDDMLLSRLSTPALTTIRQDTAGAGRMLVSRILSDHIDHEPERLATDLIVRESCGA
ncbi:LacI family DNA-binding transcriptional regulator [Sphingomonas oligoaromativorans]|jgi:DNA-binding LacI/PurR family transcriptional regulator|uniref:LacI family DNA-binding transcriptional regulator n=1 Tax=Sphingomonas oligoaromativorans TaxID=575322 RepID=UPI00141E9760|nr:substrate-binding domain-containing protein [Sphingomonas oligoaromativorans]NIJ32178.1 DNA-binding LacI/PurR family transcriptional regulator [Sphingomonas oligoaromativorans]